MRPSSTEPFLALGAQPGGRYRIVEQHSASHRTDAPWDGGDPGRPVLDLVEAHVPDESSFFIAVDADVDDDRALPDVLGPDHLPLAGGDDEYVGPPCHR